MGIHDRAGHGSPPGRRRSRLAVLAAASVLASGTAILGAPAASAEPVTVGDASFEWGINAEVQGPAFFGGCNYLSAGESDGTEATYLPSQSDVTIVKDGATPTWANKCELTDGSVHQKVVWKGGTGTVDPDTGEVSLEFSGLLSVNFYGGLVPFTIEDPVLTIDESGDGQIVATLFGYGSSMEDPDVKIPLDPVSGVAVADLSGVDAGGTGFTVTPDYEGVTYEPPEGGTPQDRTVDGWGSWPGSWVDFHYETGLTSYWYSSGGSADPKKPPTAITVSHSDVGGGDGSSNPEPGEGEQTITVTVPESTEPGEFLWSIDGDQAVDLGEATNQGTFRQATGAIEPISVTDTRTDGPEWSISGQVSDFDDDIPGSYLGWTPAVLTEGAGAVAGDPVASGIDGGDGLSVASTLASADAGHDEGTASLGADLDLRLPAETQPGSYTATLTITALS